MSVPGWQGPRLQDVLSGLPKEFGRGEETDKPNREAEGASELRRPAVDRSSSKGRSSGVFVFVFVFVFLFVCLFVCLFVLPVVRFAPALCPAPFIH